MPVAARQAVAAAALVPATADSLQVPAAGPQRLSFEAHPPLQLLPLWQACQDRRGGPVTVGAAAAVPLAAQARQTNLHLQLRCRLQLRHRRGCYLSVVAQAQALTKPLLVSGGMRSWC